MDENYTTEMVFWRYNSSLYAKSQDFYTPYEFFYTTYEFAYTPDEFFYTALPIRTINIIKTTHPMNFPTQLQIP